MFIAMGLSVIVSVLDAFGLSMFLPLLQVVDTNKVGSVVEMGNLDFLIKGIERFGFKLDIWFVLIFMIIIFLFKGMAYYLSLAYSIVLQQTFIKNIRLKLLNTLNNISFKSFIVADAGKIQNVMNGEVDRVVRAYNAYFGSFQNAIMVVVYMSFAFFVNAQFALLIMVGGLTTNIIYNTIYKLTKKASRKFSSSNNLYQGEVIQHVSNFKYLKATGLNYLYGDKMKTTIETIEASRKRMGILSSIGVAVREPMLVIVVATVILIQTQVLGGTMGTILISLLFFYRALVALVYVQLGWNEFMSVSGSLESMVDFQQEIEQNKEETGTVPFSHFKNEINIDHLTFSFGDTKILDDITLCIKKNQIVAFVGESGGGKTTLVNIIAGLLKADKGSCVVDGIPFQDLEIRSYRKRIGYITQDSVIFNDTIYNNVTAWAAPTPENIQRFGKVIRQASLFNFIEGLTKGMHTELGNNGINLSGGQKQRISIARELFKDIDILIMDEATSALDSETEVAIQQSIDALKGNYTILIVAHRLSTIRNADRIVLINKGRIENEGSFSELIYKHPQFKKLVELQEV